MKPTIFGENLMYLRRKRELTAEYVANATDMTRNRITSYEHGLAEPSFAGLIRIARFFEIPIDDLLTKSLTGL